ncbi:microtubule-associated protein tau isoform X2 [Anthonomus grandis grandis]|uniref:microtubule-associated protein tau isoform X2 n=1 Tax=Anthonomus grandis grandis TaxID=2921223 RepID=UPI002165A2EE|nr:microtubule-associated protein tau isoform X2 [Anthonomus grandis grandis]
MYKKSVFQILKIRKLILYRNIKLNSQDQQPLATAPSPQTSGPFLVRPPLSRSDSRTNFQYRPPFAPAGAPHSIGPQILSGHQVTGPLNSGPHSLSPQVISYQSGSPVNSGYPSSPLNSGPQSIGPQVLRPQLSAGARSPVGGQTFVQRGPPLGPGGTQGPRISPQGSNPVPSPPYQQTHGQRPIFRPQSPFSRPPLLAQRPQVYQQSSVPAFNRQRPGFDEQPLYRSQTLDSSELDVHKYAEENISPPTGDQRPPSVASIGRNHSINASPTQNMDRKMSSSQESVNISRHSSQENVCKKEENIPSRPESRSGSRMGKIMENENTQNRSRPESRGEIVNGDFSTKSPNKETSNHVTYVTTPRVEDLQEEIKRREARDMELKLKPNKGDNDSGVDESTQGNEQCNGDSRTPRKPNKSRTSSTTPTKGRSLSRGGSKTPSSLQSPDSAATTPGSAERKKVPMNKVQVGTAPSPNLKVVRSKIGSLENASYKPGGGKVKIESKKLDFKNAGPRIEAKNERYVPKGGDKKIMSQKLEWNAKSKIGSLENAAHKPKGGDKKIETVKLNFKEKATAKVGSKDNIKHQPGGGEVKKRGKNADIQEEDIENRKLEIHASSKVGSMDNVKHKPSGGDKKIFDDKDYLKQHGKSGKSSMDQSLSGSQHSVQSQEPKAPVADENLNQEH